MRAPIVKDFAQCKPANASVPGREDRAGCQDCIALIRAESTSTDPVTVTFDDPEREPVTIGIPDEGEEPAIQPLMLFGEKSLVARAIDAALNSGVQAVYVLGPAREPGIEADRFVALETEALAAGAASCIPFDALAYEQARTASSNYELFGQSRYVLDLCCELLNGQPAAANILILDCQQPRIEARHLEQLHFRLDQHPEADIITSWIVWLRRTPLLIRRSWLESAPMANQGIQDLKVSEVVFGEEKLAPSQTFPAAFQEFFAGCTLSALEAVTLAESLQGATDEERKAQLSTLSPQDQQLLACAEETLAETLARGQTDEDLEWADKWAQRNKVDFPIFSYKEHKGRLVFLDSAATAQRVAMAEEAMEDFDLHRNANVYRGGYDLSMQATYALNDARKVVEDHIGANRRETIYTANTTGGCNLIAQAWGLSNIQEGDLILVCLCDHHSNMLPWMMLAEQRKARLGFIPLTEDGHLDQEAYEQLLEQHPKLVCIPQVSNVLGILNPVKDMADAAHAAGARVFVDGAQSLPHLKVDVYELGVDFFAFSSHKAYGPLGIGAVWVNPEAYAEMTPVTSGGGAISHVSTDSYYLRLGAIAYELGTPPISQAMGLAAAIQYLDTLGMEDIERHSAVMTRYLMAGLDSLEGITVYGDHRSPEGLQGLVSLTVANAGPTPAGLCLGKLGVAVRSGGHCALPLSASLGVVGTTRLSLGVYTTRRDLDAACTALRICYRLFSPVQQTGIGEEGASQGDEEVQDHYARIAAGILENLDDGTVCGCNNCDDAPLTTSEAASLYSQQVLEELPEGACQASRGCGDPVAKAGLQPGEQVLDLGSGGGLDALIAARLVTSSGHVYGLDMTPEMVELATRNAADAGIANVEFIQGTIEDIPLPDGSLDVVLSNCVINFSDDKAQVCAEVFRVLKPGGRFVVSDIVGFEPIPEDCREALCRITGCTKGMQSAESYQHMLEEASFTQVRLEPKTIYSLEVLRTKAEQKDRMAFFQQLEDREDVDGASGSVIIYAVK